MRIEVSATSETAAAEVRMSAVREPAVAAPTATTADCQQTI
ncbi:hypothetical protein [Kribbella sp. NPDC050470]